MSRGLRTQVDRIKQRVDLDRLEFEAACERHHARWMVLREERTGNIPLDLDDGRRREAELRKARKLLGRDTPEQDQALMEGYHLRRDGHPDGTRGDLHGVGGRVGHLSAGTV